MSWPTPLLQTSPAPQTLHPLILSPSFTKIDFPITDAELHVLGAKMGGGVTGPQLGGKVEGHYVKECGEDHGVFKVDKQWYIDLAVEGGLGENVGLGSKIGLQLVFEVGIEADKEGADGYVSFLYKWGAEVSVHGIISTYTRVFHWSEGGPTYRTPKIKW